MAEFLLPTHYNRQHNIQERQKHFKPFPLPLFRAVVYCREQELNTSSITWAAPSEKVPSSMRINMQIQIIMRMRKASSGSLLSKCPVILLANSEGPDQTARMRSLIWAFAVRLCSKTRFIMADLIRDVSNAPKFSLNVLPTGESQLRLLNY